LETKKPNYIKCSYSISFRDLCEKLGIEYDTSRHDPNVGINTTTLPDGTIGFQITTEEYDNTVTY